MLQEFVVSEKLKLGLITKLRAKPQIFSYDSDPMLASLTCALGLQFEIGKPDWDRLSSAFGIGLNENNPWQTQIVTFNDQIGVRLWQPDSTELTPRHTDFTHILHPLSMDASGRLSQLVIFPNQVSEKYKKNRGLELVIVRDWALTSFLNQGEVHYLVANRWEIENNTAKIQAEIMTHGQVAFSGTHDLVDHLIGGDVKGFHQRYELYSRINSIYKNFPSPAKNLSLVISYIVGVILDDMAQPVWYESAAHENLLKKTAGLLAKSFSSDYDRKDLSLPPSFAALMTSLRKKPSLDIELSVQFENLRLELMNLHVTTNNFHQSI